MPLLKNLFFFYIITMLTGVKFAEMSKNGKIFDSQNPFYNNGPPIHSLAWD